MVLLKRKVGGMYLSIIALSKMMDSNPSMKDRQSNSILPKEIRVLRPSM